MTMVTEWQGFSLSTREEHYQPYHTGGCYRVSKMGCQCPSGSAPTGGAAERGTGREGRGRGRARKGQAKAPKHSSDNTQIIQNPSWRGQRRGRSGQGYSQSSRTPGVRVLESLIVRSGAIAQRVVEENAPEDTSKAWAWRLGPRNKAKSLPPASNNMKTS